MNATSGSSRSAHPLSPRALFKALPRAVDNRPIWAQLNITWRCNLSCSYCTEYDNEKGHVPYEQLVARIDKCRALGVLHTDLIGGEPLLHPDVTRLVGDVVARGMTTGMTTNGFLLTASLLAELKQAGLGRLQMSVDAVHPTEAAPKSLKTLKKKIDLCAQQGLWLWVNTVICDETLDDVEEVARFCFERGVNVNFSVVHDRGRLRRRLNNGRYLEKLRWLRAEKKAGRPVATPYYLLDYYEQTLSGKPPKWTCQAGQKSFYVSPEGNFHFCYHVPSAMELEVVTPSDLAAWGRAKGCESGCGVDCCVQTSLPFSKTLSTLSSEVRGRFGGLVGAVRARLPIVD
jgi:MoaA/NifB/PqqE/SkfB family radical SAM enzyme